MAVIGTIESTFLASGISANGRLYTPENIGRAVSRMRDRLADPQGLPITMRSHHAAGDDSKELVARITDVVLDEETSRADLTGYLIDTRAGRDIAAATEPDQDGRRVLDAVSIRGWWIGPVRTIEVDGQEVTTADDLEIDGVDLTASPGLEAARIRASTRLAAETAGPNRTPIAESVEVRVMSPAPAAPESAGATENTPTTEPGAGGQPETPVDETRTALDATITALREAWVSVSAWQDRVDINLDAYGIGNDDLQAAATQLGAATSAALKVLDPDSDGDLDLPGDGDGAGCQSCDTPLPAGANYCPGCGTAVDTEDDDSGSEESNRNERTPAVAEKTSSTEQPPGGTPEPAGRATTETEGGQPEGTEPAAGDDTSTAVTSPAQPAAPAQVMMTAADHQAIADLLARQLPQPAAAGAAVEAKGPTPEEIAEQVEQAVTNRIDGLRTEMVERYGTPRRKGLTEAAQTSQDKAPELHKMSQEEFSAFAAQAWDKVLGPINLPADQ